MILGRGFVLLGIEDKFECVVINKHKMMPQASHVYRKTVYNKCMTPKGSHNIIIIFAINVVSLWDKNYHNIR
jgi:hypothetical protein